MGVIRLTQGSAPAPNTSSTPTLGQVFGSLADPPAAAGRPRRARCPGCAAVYALAVETVPAWGARVACSECGAQFAVGARADAASSVRQLVERNADAWRSACASGALWDEFGDALFGCYEELRERYGTAVAVRAFRQAVEEAAPGAPWFGPSAPSSGEPGAVTMFERRRGE